MKTVKSHISKKAIPLSNAYKADDLHKPMFEYIQNEYPNFSKNSYISLDELNAYRKSYLSKLMEQEMGEIADSEKDVMGSIEHNTILSENIEEDIEEKLSLGQRMADHIASFGGSWKFIILFFVFLGAWMFINVWVLTTRPFDPFPFILLNLMLSCLASIQGPIIMMSQNRQAEKDRQRSEHDYKINLKAELEIKLLHEKMDHLMAHQNKKLLEIQQIQTDYLDEIAQSITTEIKPKKPKTKK